MLTIFYRVRTFFDQTRKDFLREDIGYAGSEKELITLVSKNSENDIAVVVEKKTFLQSVHKSKKVLENSRVFFLILTETEQDSVGFEKNVAPYRLDFLKKPYDYKELKNKLIKLQHIEALDGSVSTLNKEVQVKEAQLEERFFVDYLTGSYNYHYLVSKLSFCMQKLRDQMLPIVFVMIDIDNFQRIVDAHNYAFGEDILKQLSAFIRTQIRTSDILIRSGGEEFILLLPRTSRKQGLFVAGRLRTRITHQKFGTEKKTILVPVSMGLSFSSKEKPHSVKALLKQAQKALKHAKMKGGNALSLYQGDLKSKEKEIVDETIKKLRGKVYHLRERAQQDIIEMVYGFARIIEAKDNYTGKHVEDTSYIAEKVARQLRLSEHTKDNIKHAAILHDLGKVGVGQEILLKKGELTPQEMKVMKEHPVIAAEILKYIKALKGALPAIKYHHEWYNGKGYPSGLKGDEIPIEARVVAIADVYQALTSDRPYRKAFDKKTALKIITEESGTHFDPNVVKSFLKVVE